MVPLTTEQREAITHGHGAPVEVSDGERSYFLITQEQYDQWLAFLSAEEVDPSFSEFETADETSHS